MTTIPQNCTWVGGVSPADLSEMNGGEGAACTAKPVTAQADAPRDGRHARKVRSAERILHACRASMRSGDFRPSVPAIAKAVSCSDRNVFELFQTKEKLYLEALRDEETQRAILTLVLRDSLPPQTEGDRARLLRAIVLGRA